MSMKAIRNTVAALVVITLLTVAWAPAASAQPFAGPSSGFLSFFAEWASTVLKGLLTDDVQRSFTPEEEHHSTSPRKDSSQFDPFGLD